MRIYKDKKFNYTYKITNLINNKYYYGCHSSDNPFSDKYMGRGVRLKQAYEKHGKENFEMAFIENFKTRKEMFEHEAKLVTVKEMDDPMCYNLNTGGKDIGVIHSTDQIHKYTKTKANNLGFYIETPFGIFLNLASVSRNINVSKSVVKKWFQNLDSKILKPHYPLTKIDNIIGKTYSEIGFGKIKINTLGEHIIEKSGKISITVQETKMDNRHKKIKGYRDLSQEEIDLMNEAKILAESVRVLVEKISSHEEVDLRWVNIGKTDLQKGFMSLIRGIAQPTTF